MGSAPNGGGTYTLLIDLGADTTVEVGSLDTVELPAGHYAYTGSAQGSGGFSRVDRHREVARGERTVRQWHVDHLLGLPTASVTAVIRAPGVDAECTVAGSVGDGMRDGDGTHDGGDVAIVDGFGATDCGCPSHLARAADRAPLYEAAWAAQEGAAASNPAGRDAAAND